MLILQVYLLGYTFFVAIKSQHTRDGTFGYYLIGKFIKVGRGIIVIFAI